MSTIGLEMSRIEVLIVWDGDFEHEGITHIDGAAFFIRDETAEGNTNLLPLILIEKYRRSREKQAVSAFILYHELQVKKWRRK